MRPRIIPHTPAPVFSNDRCATEIFTHRFCRLLDAKYLDLDSSAAYSSPWSHRHWNCLRQYGRGFGAEARNGGSQER